MNAYNNKKTNNKLVEEIRIKNNNTEKENLGYGLNATAHPANEKVSDFINHYKNVQAAEKKLGKGFYVNPMRARNKETEGQGFYINSKKKN